MKQPIPSLQYLERYRNEGTRTYSSHAAYTEAGHQYRPDGGQAAFDLTAYQLPRRQMLVYTADPPAALAAQYLSPSAAWFLIHPQVLKSCPEDPYLYRTLALSGAQKPIAVSPSSSTRTLFVQEPGPPHAVKVHFPFKVSRYTRKMRDEVIEQAVNVSRELQSGIGHMDGRFAFLREVIGVAHQNLQPDSARGENWGYLVRDMIPFPNSGAERPLIPAFALYGKDFFDPHQPPLLYDLIGERDPLATVLQTIMLPIVRHWTAAFRHFGYIIEPHGQNVLLEVDEEGAISRIVHRDLSVGIDMRRRRDLGLPEETLNAYNRTEDGAFCSITYDRFMGGHFFDRLVAACLEKYPGLRREDFTRPVREEFARCLPDYAAYFPPTVWYFSEERDAFNKPLNKDTGAAPEWRP
jgi:siderophore synthetase component